MKETGLMFKAPLVRAILDGKKTQTRRLVKPAPDSTQNLEFNTSNAGEPYATSQDKELRWSGWASPVGKPGDRIYVREAFVQGYESDPATGALRTSDEEGNEVPKTTWYRDTDPGLTWSDDGESEVNTPWKPAIHMPKDLARIWLEVTGVRLERLQDISEADASREGLQYSTERIGHWCGNGKDWQMTPRQAFRDLWVSTGGDWAANPWVWVIDFKRLTNSNL